MIGLLSAKIARLRERRGDTRVKAHDKGPAAGSNCRRSIESCNALQSGEHVRLVSKGLQIECSQGCLPERLGHRNWMLSSNRGHLEYSFAFVGLKTHRGYVTALPQHAPSSVLTYLPTYLPTYLHTHTQSNSSGSFRSRIAKREPEPHSL